MSVAVLLFTYPAHVPWGLRPIPYAARRTGDMTKVATRDTLYRADRVTKLPWFPWYPGDWLADGRLAACTLAQQGIYVRLLSLQAREALPDDVETVTRMVGCGATEEDVRAVLNQFFTVMHDPDSGSVLKNQRLQAILDKQYTALKARQKGARKTNTRKGLSDDRPGNRPDDRLGNRNGDRPDDRGESQSQIQKEIPTTTPHTPPRRAPRKTVAALASDPEFDTFWATYPKRPNNSKADAWRKWQARRREGVIPGVMIRGAQAYAAFVDREGMEPRFVKQAATFLGPGRHWEETYEAAEPSFIPPEDEPGSPEYKRRMRAGQSGF